MVRPPRTARDVLGWVKPPRQILRRGAHFATVAPALTTAQRPHIERVLGARRVALCLVALATLASVPTWNGSNERLSLAMLGGYAIFGVLQLTGTSRRRAVRLPSQVSHGVDMEALVEVRKHSAGRQIVVCFSADPIHSRLTVDNDGRPLDVAGRLTLTELEAAGRATLVDKRRETGGELVTESSANRGVRLDILLRRRLRARSSKTA